jgi:hypothetical protein
LGYRAEGGGLVHVVEGSRLVESDPKTFFMWMRCGGDVGVTEVWASREAPTCSNCLPAAPRVEHRDEAALALKRIRLADLAYARARARVCREAGAGDERTMLEALKRARNFEVAVMKAEKEYACLGL